jgi:hypothetical protein
MVIKMNVGMYEDLQRMNERLFSITVLRHTILQLSRQPKYRLQKERFYQQSQGCLGNDEIKLT